MAKSKSIFYCQRCGAESAKWVGRCPACGEWNTYVEEIVTKALGTTALGTTMRSKPVNIRDTPSESNAIRFSTEISEFDRVLGGGIVTGSLVLIGGEPGIGKSTLLLQMAIKLKKKVLYVSGEESIQQIKMRSDRIGVTSDTCFLMAETNLSAIINEASQSKPELLIIDSIQTIHSDHLEAAIGSISQVKECSSQLMKLAKQQNIPVFLIGHVNKEGAIAGPKVLEHMVDTVLQFEGDQHLTYRILRTIKNRFGSTAELGMFEMNREGLREVTNPSEILMSPRDEYLSGVAQGATIEGNRPLIIETQALVSPSSYGNPQRSPTGYDYKRLNMLIAVMEKRLGVRLSLQDVFLNLAGGLKIQDTALDLAICVSLFSSFEDLIVPKDYCFAAEVGLGGELRAVNRIENRINEAEKLGFKRIYASRHNIKGLGQKKGIEVEAFGKLSDLLQNLF